MACFAADAGRKLQVGYSGSHGEVGRYLCCARREERGSGSCFSMGRLKVDHWAGGVHTELVVPRNKTGNNGRMAEGKVIELVGELVKVCDDKTIAAVLNRLGYRTGKATVGGPRE